MQYDVAVIGGGVVGCSLLHELTRRGYRCVLLERKEHLVAGASAGNSGHAHSGFDTDPASFEGRLLTKARTLATDHFYESLGVPYKKVGALLVAWDTEQLKKLPEVVRKSHLTGLGGVRQITQSQLRYLEPNLSHNALGAVIIPDEALVDPWLLPVMLVHNAQRNGAKVNLSSEVTSCRRLADGGWLLTTSNGQVEAKVVINAAGLYGDKVEEMAGGTSSFSILPRQGQYAVYGREAAPLLRHIILPLPTARTKGVTVFPTVYGNVVVGPTAEDVDERDNPTVDGATIDRLVSYAIGVLPALRDHKIIGTYAGLRPATASQDYHIYGNVHRQWITVGGIRSTGLSASQAIARHVGSILSTDLKLSPSHCPLDRDIGGATKTWSTDCTELALDGAGYKVTHPLTAFGLRKCSKL
ncbi:uncharacterized protein LOC106171696 [Lingula anatina]|uniref:Uncharacterized protein LOC106171696 n=1 Tax=Lingula anatina TaxID=7574 RepID=A0A1S3JB15_LINAN|nr:uncharacterized protein LOC106171696 [Lingula anatina]|eukprot:XP_013407595.1 uncharacterized protein LOC106171696 [Lingula anatina]